MFKYFDKIFFTFAIFICPYITSALEVTRGVEGLISIFKNTFSSLTNILVLAALIVFMWGVIEMILSSSKNKFDATQKVMWGILGLFVILSVWALVALMSDSLKIPLGGNFS